MDVDAESVQGDFHQTEFVDRLHVLRLTKCTETFENKGFKLYDS